MTTGTQVQAATLFKNACWQSIHFPIMRYLMSNADGRWDGAEKAQRHLEMSYFYVAVVKGLDVDAVRLNEDEAYMAVHDATQALTDNLDEAIGFPLRGRPDYEALAPVFFEKFHALALQALGLHDLANMAVTNERTA